MRQKCCRQALPQWAPGQQQAIARTTLIKDDALKIAVQRVVLQTIV